MADNAESSLGLAREFGNKHIRVSVVVVFFPTILNCLKDIFLVR